ncbi:MAG: helix-turn-helix transcriptional regulator [Anaerolineales bacterium]|nr:helix-turn-helix transcriptional regulator [Anaerolineales bacterium]
MEKFKPTPILLIEDLETLKVLADPFRNQILEALAPSPLTVNQVAERLGLPASKLYYHVNMLEAHGLIQVVDTTMKANLIEKRYWVAAYKCELSEGLCNFLTPEGQESAVTSMVAPIETTREDIIRSLRARAHALERGAEPHPREVIVFRELRNISDERATALIARLKEITDEFKALENQEIGEDVQTHALTIAFYPSFYYSEEDQATGG